MVLVDTSVWIRYFKNQQPYAEQLDALLSLDRVVGHEHIYGELLIGDRGRRQKFLVDYQQIHHASTIPHSEVVDFVRSRHLHGLGAGWIDIHLLASAIVGHFSFWTADARTSTIAAELGIAYTPA